MSLALILQGKVLGDFMWNLPDFHISKFLYTAGRVREAALLSPRGR